MSNKINYPKAHGTLPANDDLPTRNDDIGSDTTLIGRCSENDMSNRLLGTSLRSPKWEHVACDLCGEDNAALWLKKDGFRYVRCLRCGLVYVTPRLRDHFLQQEKFYQVVKGGSLEAAAEWDRNPKRMRSLTRAARSYLPYKRNGNLLDVGCGFGAFLDAAKSVGWRVCGVEVAHAPASITARHHDVFYGLLSDAPYEPDSFDVVRLNDVLEHAASPRALLQDIRRLLRPGGLLFISTPNATSFTSALKGVEWRYVQGENHIYLFSVRTIGRLLEIAGFKIVSLSTAGFRLIDRNGSRESRPFSLRKLTWQAVKGAERMLDVAARITLRGHRMRIMAEKAT